MKDTHQKKTDKIAKTITHAIETPEDHVYQKLIEALELSRSNANKTEQIQIVIAGIRQDIAEYLTYNGYSEKMHDAISDIIDKHSKV
jgi:hypothetical protein